MVSHKTITEIRGFFIRKRRICKERRADNVKELVPLQVLSI